MTFSDDRHFIYHINHEDELIYANDDWYDFAKENEAGYLVADRMYGQSLWNFIIDPETINLYQTIFHKVRKNNTVLTLPFRCDSPELRRYMKLTIAKMDSGIQLTGRVLKLEKRDKVLLFDAHAKRTNKTLRICAWCKKVEVEGNWHEVETVIERLKLFQKTKLPQLDHVMCNNCYKILNTDV